jgi:hypothetical protein
MHRVYDRKGQPPVPVPFNDKGQPDGVNASEFNNFIATHVKSHIPLGHADWRQVDVEKKNEIMTELRVCFGCCTIYKYLTSLLYSSILIQILACVEPEILCCG